MFVDLKISKGDIGKTSQARQMNTYRYPIRPRALLAADTGRRGPGITEGRN